MHLSAVAQYGPISVLRDGPFVNLGFARHQHEGMLVFAESGQFLCNALRNKNISAVLTTPQLAESVPGHLAVGVCENPRLAFAILHNELARQGFYWDDFATVIDPDAQVHPAAWVAEKNVRIEAGTTVGPRATILERCIVGREVAVGAGCILGGVGFQTVRKHGAMLEMEHAGGLEIKDRVRLLPGAIIATGLFRESTTLANGVRVGSLAFVSHGVQVGARSFVGHGAVVNGGVTIGQDAWIGPGAVVAHEREIGDKAFVSLGAVVIRNVPSGSHRSGNFAVPHRPLLRFLAGLDSDFEPR
jgi:UDP-3-O-[3-hydroxymyristoyl] glucosamine N-acyltransferase